jgi:hypothetical protein
MEGWKGEKVRRAEEQKLGSWGVVMVRTFFQLNQLNQLDQLDQLNQLNQPVNQGNDLNDLNVQNDLNDLNHNNGAKYGNNDKSGKNL